MHERRKPFSRHYLRQLRNQISVQAVLEHIGWPHKYREGRFCFQCPDCSEFLTATNPTTNLGRCFRCGINFNPLDLVLLIHDCDFVTAVYYLQDNHLLSNG